MEKPKKSLKLMIAEKIIFLMPWVGWGFISQGFNLNSWVWLGGCFMLAPVMLYFMLWLDSYMEPRTHNTYFCITPDMLVKPADQVKPEVRH